MKVITSALCATLLFSMLATCSADTIGKKAVKPAAIYCPVTGELIPSPKDAYNSEVYKGKTYYFCCAGCKPMFDADRAKYIKLSETYGKQSAK